MMRRVRSMRIYFFALSTALRAIASGQVKNGMRLMIASVGYWRLLPNEVVWEEAARFSNPRVLDVSSPKLVSLWLAAKCGAQVLATDLDDAEIFNRWAPFAKIRGLGGYRVEFEDARNLPAADASFDLVYSLSVIEHIPGMGDREALSEFARVVKPGGAVVIEVPYRRKYENVFRDTDSKGAALNEPRFFERRYDAEALEKRLMHVDGLRVEQKWILGEWVPVDPVINGNRTIRLITAPLAPWLALVNYWMRRDDRAGRPLGALIVYRKPA